MVCWVKEWEEFRKRRCWIMILSLMWHDFGLIEFGAEECSCHAGRDGDVLGWQPGGM